ncbi:MAG: GNAT family N-acetyltransferase [Gemmatimonadetes bacterium]|nr:GNAT family N-acetyltransferase [Gemmatimonadota bacterium]
MIAKILQTPHLRLVPASAEHVKAELDAHEAFSALLGAAVPESWPPGEYDEFTQRFFLARLVAHGKRAIGWYGWYAIRDAAEGVPATLVAIGGYYGPPSPEGVVEIGYSVCPEWRGRGYATECVQALMAHALQQEHVTRILAHAFEANPASVKVLERCGFARVGPGAEPGVFRFTYPAESPEG